MTLETQLQTEELEEMASGEYGEICMILGWKLSAYVYPSKLGRMFDGHTSFEPDPTLPKKEPDVAFVMAGRLTGRIRGSVPLAPDLAVEVVSPTDKQFEVEEKALDYIAIGVRLVWVISPVTKVVEVYRPGQDKPSIYGVNDELDGENVIPGFKLKVRDLFEVGY